MTILSEFGIIGSPSGLSGIQKIKWLLPLLVLLSAAAVIGLLFFSLNQSTEAKFLKMQYFVEEVEADADAKVRLAQQEVFLMSQKYTALQTDIAGMQKQLSQLQKSPVPIEVKDRNRPKGKRGNRIKSRHKGGLEDLHFGGETAVSSAKDDPTIGFRKGELL